MTDSMAQAMGETDRRRAIQTAYNQEHGITPTSIIRPVDMALAGILKAEYSDVTEEAEAMPDSFHSEEDLDAYIAKLEVTMREAAQHFEFEKAAKVRDTIRELRGKDFLFDAPKSAAPTPNSATP
jgi:excinuclease ABC subunit B